MWYGTRHFLFKSDNRQTVSNFITFWNVIHHLTVLLQKHIRPQKQMNINLSLFLIKYHFIVLYILRGTFRVPLKLTVFINIRNG